MISRQSHHLQNGQPRNHLLGTSWMIGMGLTQWVIGDLEVKVILENEDSPSNSNLFHGFIQMARIKKSFVPNLEGYVFNIHLISHDNSTYEYKTIAVKF